MTRKVLTLVADVANANAVAQKIGQGPLAERQPTSSGAVAIPLPTQKRQSWPRQERQLTGNGEGGCSDRCGALCCRTSVRPINPATLRIEPQDGLLARLKDNIVAVTEGCSTRYAGDHRLFQTNVRINIGF